MTRSRRASHLVAAVVALATWAGCADVEVPESIPEPGAATGTSEPPERAEEAGEPGETEEVGDAEGDGGCLGSLEPDGPAGTDVAQGSYMEEIQQRDPPVLRIGVDVGTPQFSSVDPQTGRPEGFDVDIGRQVAAALLGDPEDVELVGITADERISALLDRRVDLVVHNFSITCDRWEEIDFSTRYFTTYQRILVPRGSNAESIEDLDGERVCATGDSTPIEHIDGMDEPRPLPVEVGERAECLMLLQQGQVDALATDDAILVGMVAQDPTLKLGEERFNVPQHYGIGLPPGRPEWVRYVNAVLEDVRESGEWNRLYEEWLVDMLADIEGHGTDPAPPTPEYED